MIVNFLLLSVLKFSIDAPSVWIVWFFNFWFGSRAMTTHSIENIFLLASSALFSWSSVTCKETFKFQLITWLNCSVIKSVFCHPIFISALVAATLPDNVIIIIQMTINVIQCDRVENDVINFPRRCTHSKHKHQQKANIELFLSAVQIQIVSLHHANSIWFCSWHLHDFHIFNTQNYLYS